MVKENRAAAAVVPSPVREAFEPWALGRQTSLWPKTTLLKILLHSFEPPWHGGMVIRKIE